MNITNEISLKNKIMNNSEMEVQKEVSEQEVLQKVSEQEVLQKVSEQEVLQKEVSEQEVLQKVSEEVSGEEVSKQKVKRKTRKIMGKKVLDITNTKLTDKETEVINEVLEFYKNPVNKNILISVVRQKTAISLRLLDWFTTNYSKKFSIRYNLDDTNGNEYIYSDRSFNVHANYKNQLKRYLKKLFDPFCRRQRIFFNTVDNSIKLLNSFEYEVYNNLDEGIVTTPGQLNFFKWAITNRVIHYTFEHLNEIETDMLKTSEKRTKKDDKGKKTRKSLSKNNHSAVGHKVKLILKFH